MNDQQRAAMQMAFEYIDWILSGNLSDPVHEALTVEAALREALAQPQGEPVAWIHRYKTGAEQINTAPPETYVGWTHTPLYTTPLSVEAAIEATKEKAIAALQGVATGRLDVVEAIRSMK